MRLRSEYLADAFQKLIDDISAAHQAAGQEVSGRTIRSLEYTVTETGGQLLGARYFSILEDGRRPGGMPPIDEIEYWAMSRDIVFESDAEMRSFAWAVAKTIEKRGSLLFREGGRQDIYTPALETFTTYIMEQTGEHFAVEIANLFDNIE